MLQSSWVDRINDCQLVIDNSVEIWPIVVLLSAHCMLKHILCWNFLEMIGNSIEFIAINNGICRCRKWWKSLPTYLLFSNDFFSMFSILSCYLMSNEEFGQKISCDRGEEILSESKINPRNAVHPQLNFVFETFQMTLLQNSWNKHVFPLDSSSSRCVMSLILPITFGLNGTCYTLTHWIQLHSPVANFLRSLKIECY